MNEVLQVAFMNAPKPAEQWIQLFPAGRWTDVLGRTFFIPDPYAVIARSIRPKTDLVIDRDHQRVLKPQEPFTAAGWMKEFEVRNGEIWARVEWVDWAAHQLRSKEYRYFSPQFKVSKETGEIYSFNGGSICCEPAFELEAIASASPQLQTKEQTEMDKNLIKLAALLGLAATVSTEVLVASATARLEKVNELETQVASLLKAAELDNKTAPADAVKKIEEMVASVKQAATGTDPDPKKYVPKDMYDAVASSVKKLEDTIAQEKAETIVASALKDGKITPAQKEWAMKYAKASYDEFKDFVEKAPKIVDQTATATRKTADGQASKLTDEETMVASQLGLTEEQYLGKKDEGKKAA